MLMAKKNKKKYSMGDETSNKDRANKQERRIEDIFRTPNSGAIAGMKADLFVGDIAIDIKSALKSNQIIITVSMLKKLIDDALESGKNPALLLNFPQSNLIHKEWIMRPLQE